MTAERDGITPLQRLARSRSALVAQLHGAEPAAARAPDSPARHSSPHSPRKNLLDPIPWGPVTRHLVKRWWRRHPANAAGQLARPLLDRYAREQPATLIAAAAAAGALVVLVKPWRLLSITAVLAAVTKTSDVADLVTTLMHKTTSPRKDPP